MSIRVLVSLFVLLPSLAAARSLPPELDTFIEDVRADWRVVGLSIAVVKDGSVVYARGFGERARGSGELVLRRHTDPPFEREKP